MHCRICRHLGPLAELQQSPCPRPLAVGCCLPLLQVYGHVHAYERYLPAFNLSVFSTGGSSSGGGDAPPQRYDNPRATVHVTSGAGGNSEMHTGTEPPPQV